MTTCIFASKQLAVKSCEALVSYHKTTRRHNSEGLDLAIHRLLTISVVKFLNWLKYPCSNFARVSVKTGISMLRHWNLSWKFQILNYIKYDTKDVLRSDLTVTGFYVLHPLPSKGKPLELGDL